MKELKINKVIEQEVETIILLGNQISELKKKYPECFRIIKKQFNFDDFSDRNYIPDDIENVKISLYAGIIRQNNRNTKLKEKKIKNNLTNREE